MANKNGYQRLVDFLRRLNQFEDKTNFPAIKAFSNAFRAKFGQVGTAREAWLKFNDAQAHRNEDYVLPQCMIRYLDEREIELRRRIAKAAEKKPPAPPPRVSTGKVLRDTR